MRAVLLLAASSVALAAPKWYQLKGYTFDQYVQDFQKEYSDEEYLKRRVIFERRVAMNIEHNSKGRSWKNGVNKFTDWTDAERRGIHGYESRLGKQRRHHNLMKSTTPSAAHTEQHERSRSLIKDIRAFSWVQMGYVNSVPDQGQCGSCWAFASKAVLESRFAIEHNTHNVPTLSPQQLVTCVPNPMMCGGTGGCGGSTPELAYEYVQGAPLRSQFVDPYSSYSGNESFPTSCPLPHSRGITLEGYAVVPSNDQSSFVHALQSGPLVVAVYANGFMDYESGIFSGCADGSNGNLDLNHAVTVTGLGADDNGAWWEVRNSWGASWGEGGIIRIHRDTQSQPQCYNDTTPEDGGGCLNPPGPPVITACGECGILYDAVYPLKPQYYSPSRSKVEKIA